MIWAFSNIQNAQSAYLVRAVFERNGGLERALVIWVQRCRSRSGSAGTTRQRYQRTSWWTQRYGNGKPVKIIKYMKFCSKYGRHLVNLCTHLQQAPNSHGAFFGVSLKCGWQPTLSYEYSESVEFQLPRYETINKFEISPLSDLKKFDVTWWWFVLCFLMFCVGRFFVEAVKFLEKHLSREGIFRKAGSVARQKALRVTTSFFFSPHHPFRLHRHATSTVTQHLFLSVSLSLSRPLWILDIPPFQKTLMSMTWLVS